MKKIALLSGLLMAFVTASFAQSEATEPVKTDGAKISVDKETHDYGDIKQGADGSCVFVIKNTGTEPLLISRAKGSCGCTVPEWPEEPIEPGKSAEMKVTYDTNRPGQINKTVTITSNAVNDPMKIVYIKGNVEAAPSGVPVVKEEGLMHE